jgi:hypothetical protein
MTAATGTHRFKAATLPAAKYIAAQTLRDIRQGVPCHSECSGQAYNAALHPHMQWALNLNTAVLCSIILIRAGITQLTLESS